MLQQLSSDIELAGYTDQTRTTYLHAAKEFAEFHGRSPEEMGHSEIREWFANYPIEAPNPPLQATSSCAEILVCAEAWSAGRDGVPGVTSR